MDFHRRSASVKRMIVDYEMFVGQDCGQRLVASNSAGKPLPQASWHALEV
jgi:hypothetical protein